MYSEAFRKDLVYWALMAVLFAAGMTAFLYVALRHLGADAGAVLHPDWQADNAALVQIAVRKLRKLWARVRAALGKKRWKAATGAVCLFLAAYLVLNCWLPPLRHAPVSIGHRGCNAAIENTVEAVLAADAAGMDYAEIDVQLTADGVPVVFHDTGLSRLSDASGSPCGLHVGCAADGHAARRIRAPRGNREDPLARDGAAGGAGSAERHRPAHRAQGRRPAAGAACRGRHPARRAVRLRRQGMFMSLDYYSVMLLHAAHPEWWVGYCVFGSVGDIDDSIWRYNIDFLAVEENMVTNRLVTQAREHGLPTYVWSVNDNEKMLQYMEMGAVGIISDWTDTRAVVDAFNAAHSGVEYAGRDEAPAQDTARLQ